MTEFAKIRARLVKCDGEKVKALAAKLGLTSIEQIALKVGRDPKTIQAMLAGEGNFKSVVKDVADMFGVKPEAILATEPEIVTSKGTITEIPRRTRTLIFKIPENAFENTDTITIVLEISKTAKTRDDMTVIDDEKGSRLIHVEMSEDDASRVLNAFFACELRRLKIRSITLLPDTNSQTPIEYHEPEFRDEPGIDNIRVRFDFEQRFDLRLILQDEKPTTPIFDSFHLLLSHLLEDTSRPPTQFISYGENGAAIVKLNKGQFKKLLKVLPRFHTKSGRRRIIKGLPNSAKLWTAGLVQRLLRITIYLDVDLVNSAVIQPTPADL